MFSTDRLFRVSLVAGLVACVNGGVLTVNYDISNLKLT
jgi:hypothetical protein